jgi:hypothetical protein
MARIGFDAWRDAGEVLETAAHYARTCEALSKTRRLRESHAPSRIEGDTPAAGITLVCEPLPGSSHLVRRARGVADAQVGLVGVGLGVPTHFIESGVPHPFRTGEREPLEGGALVPGRNILTHISTTTAAVGTQ